MPLPPPFANPLQPPPPVNIYNLGLQSATLHAPHWSQTGQTGQAPVQLPPLQHPDLPHTLPLCATYAGSIGFTRRAGATRLTHYSISDMLLEYPAALPQMAAPKYSGGGGSSGSSTHVAGSTPVAGDGGAVSEEGQAAGDAFDAAEDDGAQIQGEGSGCWVAKRCSCSLHQAESNTVIACMVVCRTHLRTQQLPPTALDQTHHTLQRMSTVRHPVKHTLLLCVKQTPCVPGTVSLKNGRGVCL